MFLLQFNVIYDNIIFVIWWVGLGILSSIGLGSGLHTFVLFTGPHIVTVTLENNNLSFMEIYMKVITVAFLWGAGTAIGELPPYFISKAGTKNNVFEKNIIVQNMLYYLKKYTFVTILLFASIPNPLFDLAGMASGMFGINFITFFVATFIGKAMIKAQLQTMAVIKLFTISDLSFLNSFPFIQNFIINKKNAYINKVVEEEDFFSISTLWNVCIIGMILYFVMSIIDTTVEDYKKDMIDKSKKIV